MSKYPLREGEEDVPQYSSNKKNHPYPGPALFISIFIVVTVTLAFAIKQNFSYVLAIGALLNQVNLNYTPIDLYGLPQAVLATIQIVTIGTFTARTILPVEDGIHHGTLLLKIASLGFGFALIGLLITILADVGFLYLWSIEISILAMIVIILVSQKLRLKNRFGAWAKSTISVWKFNFQSYETYEKLLFVVVSVIALMVYYDAVMYPVSETDSLIYHASVAAIAYYNHGMPIIDGGGIGLGSSANYPLLFSFLGTYYNFFVGQVQDLYLRIITPTMWLLSILATYLVGCKLGGRKVGSIAAFLMSVVPSYTLYGFQATGETTVTFFSVLGFLFLIYAISKGSMYYFAGSGISFGAACLTTYQAFYLVVPLVLVLVMRYANLWLRDIRTKNLSVFLVSLTAFGSVPYLKNIIILHNPVYPFFTGVFPSTHISDWLFSVTTETWKYVAYSLVNPTDPTLTAFLTNLISYPSFYPLNLTLVIPALLFVPIIPFLKQKWLLLMLIVVPSALILITIPFVRYFWLMLPYTAIIVASMLVYANDVLLMSPRINKRVKNAAKLTPYFILATMLIFPTFVLVGGQSYTFIPGYDDSSTDNYLRFFNNPGENASVVERQLYGSDVSAWGWLTENVNLEKVATFESRVYYMHFALELPSHIFYLDTSHAIPLYQLDNPLEILGFMRNNDIGFIFIRVEDWKSILFKTLPLSNMLGSPYFPLVFEDGLSKVFSVGPLENPIINSSVLAYTYGFSTTDLVDKETTVNVTANSNEPRLFIETGGALLNVGVKYLDKGTGNLIVNVFNPDLNDWIFDYATVQKHDSGEWLDFNFIVPINNVRNYTELGLHADGSNFTVKQIKISNIFIQGRASYLFINNVNLSNLTRPSSLMVYLPLLNNGSNLIASTNSQNYNVSVELYSGYLPVNQTTNWWLGYQNVARDPPLSVAYGIENPSLQWTVSDTGLYTLVIVLWDSIPTNVNISLSIALGASR